MTSMLFTGSSTREKFQVLRMNNSEKTLDLIKKFKNKRIEGRNVGNLPSYAIFGVDET